MIKCKECGSATCPQELDICCGVCPMKKNCGNCCELSENAACESRLEAPDDASGFALAIPSTISRLKEIARLKKQLDEEEKALKIVVYRNMEVYGIPKYDDAEVTFSKVVPSVRVSIDSAKLKKLHPDIAEECSKSTQVAGTIKVVLKNGG